MKRFLVLALFSAVLVGSGAPASAQQDNPVTLGKHLVKHLGCLFCHGLGGRKGIENANAERKYVPAWDEQEFIDTFQKPDQVKAVIVQGRFPKKAEGAAGNPIPMPPWGNRLKPEEMDAIIAYIWYLRDTPKEVHEKGGKGADDDESISREEAILAHLRTPEMKKTVAANHHTGNPEIDLGHALVEHLGCLHCHGLGGRQGIPNPAAKRKFIPAWDAKEFAVRYPVDDGVRWVITNGRKPEKDPGVAGSPIPMPPWGNRLKPEELDAIITYIFSLRDTPVESHSKGGRGTE